MVAQAQWRLSSEAAEKSKEGRLSAEWAENPSSSEGQLSAECLTSPRSSTFRLRCADAGSLGQVDRSSPSSSAGGCERRQPAAPCCLSRGCRHPVSHPVSASQAIRARRLWRSRSRLRMLSRLVENDPPWDACAGEVTPHDMCECVCVGVYVVPLVCARQNRFNPDSG